MGDENFDKIGYVVSSEEADCPSAQTEETYTLRTIHEILWDGNFPSIPRSAAAAKGKRLSSPIPTFEVLVQIHENMIGKDGEKLLENSLDVADGDEVFLPALNEYDKFAA